MLCRLSQALCFVRNAKVHRSHRRSFFGRARASHPRQPLQASSHPLFICEGRLTHPAQLHTQQNLDLDPIRRRADVDACSHKRLIRPPWTYIIHIIDRIQGGFLRGANWFKFNWAGFENTESEFRQIWQDDICVMGGSNQIVHPHVNAVTLACPHAVRWDEGVWTHSLCQAHNEHISFMKLHPHSVETFIHNTQVSHSLSEVLWCWRTLLYTRFLYKYKVTSFIEFVKYIGLSYTVCYRDLYSVLYRDLWDCANINDICLRWCLLDSQKPWQKTQRIRFNSHNLREIEAVRGLQSGCVTRVGVVVSKRLYPHLTPLWQEESSMVLFCFVFLHWWWSMTKISG